MERPYRNQEWLYQKYHEERLTQREIAEECGVSPRTIRTYMNEFEIETREVKGENHGLHGEERCEEVKQKISETLQGRTFSEETRRRMAEAHRGKTTPPEVKAKISRSLTGLTRPTETREQMSESTAGEQNPNWKGGHSARYGPSWGPIRERVRERDEVCQHCQEDGSERGLHVHHIVPVRKFRNSEDCELEDAHSLDNLVLLCSLCHARVEHGLIELT
ncbi:MAG: NUMOD3 domain-containing DNA-binding protein [Halobacteriales archaeon]